MADVVRVGEQRLIGEILNMTGDRASIQVYEETAGLGPGAEVVSPPARPCPWSWAPASSATSTTASSARSEEIMRIERARTSPAAWRSLPWTAEKQWAFTPTAAEGRRPGHRRRRARHRAGDRRPSCTRSWCRTASPATRQVSSKRGTTPSTRYGRPSSGRTTATSAELTMMQKWPVRVGRPYPQEALPRTLRCSPASAIIDTMFPIAKGGTAAVPGPFGSRQDRRAAPAGQVGGRRTSSSTSAAASAATR